MYLFHNAKTDAHLLDCEGRSYRIPPNVAWEVPEIHGTDCNGSQAYAPWVMPVAKVAKVLCQEGIHYGLVVVPERRTANGIAFDLEAAAILSTNARREVEDSILNKYVKAAKEDELAKLPVKPPSAPIERILNERGLDLKRDFGIMPVGYKVTEAAAQRDAQLAALETENQTFRGEIAELKEMVSQLLKQNDKKPTR